MPWSPRPLIQFKRDDTRVWNATSRLWNTTSRLSKPVSRSSISNALESRSFREVKFHVSGTVGVDFKEGGKPENPEKTPRSTEETNYNNCTHTSSNSSWESTQGYTTRFTYSKTLKALVLNFRTALRSVTRMYSAHSGIDSGIGRKRKLTLIITLILILYYFG